MTPYSVQLLYFIIPFTFTLLVVVLGLSRLMYYETIVKFYVTPPTAAPYNLGFTAGNVAEGRRGLWVRG